MDSKGLEFFEDILEAHQREGGIKEKYRRLRAVLNRACRYLTLNAPVQFPSFAARLNYVCDYTGLDARRTYLVKSFRVNAAKAFYASFIPGATATQEQYLQDLKALCTAMSHFFDLGIPSYIEVLLPETTHLPTERKEHSVLDRLRAEVVSVDTAYIYAFDEDHPSILPLKIRHHLEGVNAEFNATIAALRKGSQINLVDYTIDDEGVYVPEFIILEPDYLVDISSLAECVKEYGSHPLNYIQSRFEPLKNTKHLLLGNAANLFLDELVNEQADQPVSYADAVRKVFKGAPFEFSTCADLNSRHEEMAFFDSTRTQFENIQQTVHRVFPELHISTDGAILEPAFICEHFGIQGRLDFLQLSSPGKKSVIELKSGKAPYPETNPALIGKNHTTQAFLYQIIIQKVLGIPFRELNTYIFYSKYTDSSAGMRLTNPTRRVIREALNMRNLIVAQEYGIAHDPPHNFVKELIEKLTPETLIRQGSVRQDFLDKYIIPQIGQFTACFKEASPLEQAYFNHFYSFVAKEHYLSKAGEPRQDSNKSTAALWLTDTEDKIEAGEILIDLTITTNHTFSGRKPTLTLSIPALDQEALPNFRQGDLVVLYERNAPADNVTNRQIFKGTIEAIDSSAISIRLRYRQRSSTVLPAESKYAVEADYLDSAYNAMYRGLYSFLLANASRKSLLLHQRQPIKDTSLSLTGNYANDTLNDIVLQAKQAKDYFLLIGPPGTGKTSKAINAMVAEFYSDPAANILLLAYTNRAVDELCDSLDRVPGAPPYIRIGSELSCKPKHRHRLLDQVIADCNSREQVRKKIQEHRIFAGTVSSFSSKTELFRLKHFSVAIIDEASQIIEPPLLGLLCARNSNGGDAISKFILIGDHKQLPAVVMQDEKDSVVSDPALLKTGLINRRNSLFERLYHLHKHDTQSGIWRMLHQQGRMHTAIAHFPNLAFYRQQLTEAHTPHQLAGLPFIHYNPSNAIEQLIATRRVAFIPSEKHAADRSFKTNIHEAAIITNLLETIYRLCISNQLTLLPDEPEAPGSHAISIGVITSYRSQIALLKKEISRLNIPALNDITIDTVERYQGSQRDIIIYSFCANEFYQLDTLSNCIEEDGQRVDRKLNVAITRAKRQLFVTGNPFILCNHSIYFPFIEYIRSQEGYVQATPAEFAKGHFQLEYTPAGDRLYQLDTAFMQVFEQQVLLPLRSYSATRWPDNILGHTHDYNRLCLLQYGRASFDRDTTTCTATDLVMLYNYYFLRKHYVSTLAVFDYYRQYFTQLLAHQPLLWIDLGCGPLTSGLAFRQQFPTQSFSYIGIDKAPAMLQQANAFARSGLFPESCTFQWQQTLEAISDEFWAATFQQPHVVLLNCAYVFAALDEQAIQSLAQQVNRLLDTYPRNKFVLLFQNTAPSQRDSSYRAFKRYVPRLIAVSEAQTITVGFTDPMQDVYDTSSPVFFELLSF